MTMGSTTNIKFTAELKGRRVWEVDHKLKCTSSQASFIQDLAQPLSPQNLQ